METILEKSLITNPEITVILINYNQENFLESSIQSVLDQSLKNFEFIIIDNGSTDGSKNIIKKYLNDDRIVFLNYDENLQVTKRLNYSVSIAKGKYINFLMADDMLIEDKLLNQIKIFNNLDNSYGVVYGPSITQNIITNNEYIANVVRINGEALKIQLGENLLLGHININSALIKKECLIKYPMLEEIFIETESIFLCFALSFNFYFDSKPVCLFREHNKNIGKKIFDNLNRHLKRIEVLKKLNMIEKKCDNKEIDNYKGNIIFNICWYSIRTNGPRKYNWRLIYDIFLNHKFLIFKFKFLLLLILNITPKIIVKYLNNIYDSLKKNKVNNIRLD